jgi:hypothetical protein
MTKNIFRATLFVLMAWMVAPQAARACDCVNAGLPCKAFGNTPAIFAGRVAKITATSSGYHQVTFYVTQDYRGLNMNEKIVDVLTGMGGGDCGYEFKQGVSYLVYALNGTPTMGEAGKLFATICTRTRPLSEAKDDIEYLTKKDDPARGAGIEGDIYALARDAKNVTTVTGPLAGITVVISGVAVRKTVVTRKDGHFQIWGLDPGSYRVSPTLPGDYLKTAQTVKLAALTCEEVHFLATPPPKKVPK